MWPDAAPGGLDGSPPDFLRDGIISLTVALTALTHRLVSEPQDSSCVTEISGTTSEPALCAGISELSIGYGKHLGTRPPVLPQQNLRFKQIPKTADASSFCSTLCLQATSFGGTFKIVLMLGFYYPDI